MTNTGNVTITHLAIAEGAFDGQGTMGAATCPVTTLAPGKDTTCTAPYTPLQADADAGSVTNTAAASGVDPSGDPVVSEPDTYTLDAIPGAFTVTKTVDKTVASAGQTVTYTVHVANSGTVPVTAWITDDVADVVDDANLGPLPTGLSRSGTTLSWTGVLAVGGFVNLVYTATLHDPLDGDLVLRNVVVPGDKGTCVTQCSTETGTTAFTVDQSVDKTLAAPGDVVTYTVPVESTGSAPVHASFSDDLTAVLDDATLKLPLGTGLSFDSATGTMSWAGDLAADGKVDVTYKVQIKAASATSATGGGDSTLTNVVMVDPDTPGVCGDVCTTRTDVRALAVKKTSDVVGSLKPGDRVTYTVALTNTGAAGYTVADPASVVDDLASLLDDATYNGDAKVSVSGGAASTAGVTYVGMVLSWRGALPAHASAVLTYSVTTKSTGDLTLRNAAFVPDDPGCDTTTGACAPPPDCVGVTCSEIIDHLVDAIDDTNHTAVNKAVSGTVLTNDVGIGITVTSNTAPSHGTVTIKPDGTYTYTPAPGWSGPDSFTYTITDRFGNTDTATVSLNVGLKVTDDQSRTMVGTSKDGTTLINDEGTSLKVIPYTQPARGTVVVNPDGTYTYTPEKGWSGPDSFTYTVTDPFGQTATATVWIVIDPRAYNDSSSTTANGPARGNLLSNDDGTGLVVTSHTQPSHGTVTVNPDGTYVYVPAPGFAGTDTFTYTITDVDGQTSTAVFTVVVAPPVAPAGGSVGSARGSGLAVAGFGVLAGATILVMAARRRLAPVR